MPRRGADGAASVGKSPEAIMRNRSFAQSLKVSSWRLGIRVSLRFVCRVSTAIGTLVIARPLGEMRRCTGTARTRVGVSSYQSGADESRIRPLSNASVTSAFQSA